MSLDDTFFLFLICCCLYDSSCPHTFVRVVVDSPRVLSPLSVMLSPNSSSEPQLVSKGKGKGSTLRSTSSPVLPLAQPNLPAFEPESPATPTRSRPEPRTSVSSEGQGTPSKPPAAPSGHNPQVSPSRDVSGFAALASSSPRQRRKLPATPGTPPRVSGHGHAPNSDKDIGPDQDIAEAKAAEERTQDLRSRVGGEEEDCGADTPASLREFELNEFMAEEESVSADADIADGDAAAATTLPETAAVKASSANANADVSTTATTSSQPDEDDDDEDVGDDEDEDDTDALESSMTSANTSISSSCTTPSRSKSKSRWAKITQLPAIAAKVGDRIAVVHSSGTRKGRLMFYGFVKFSPGPWAGVAYERKLGKHNGTKEGVSYFQCQQGHGSFVRPDAIKKIREEKKN